MTDDKTTIGWRELVALPEWGIERVVAKMDTGARTSAIDVASIVELPSQRVRFEVVVDRGHPERRQACEARISRTARVKSSHGTVHERVMIETVMRLGGISKTIEIGLVCRRSMICRMLIGRNALKPEFIVDPSRRYVCGRRVRENSSRKRRSPS